MTLSLLASLRRLAPQAQRRAVRQLGSASAGGEGEATASGGDESRARPAAAAAAELAAGGGGRPATGLGGEARAGTLSGTLSDGVHAQPERESGSEGSAEAAAAEAAAESPLSEDDRLRNCIRKVTCWSAVLYYVDAVVQSPDTVLPALGSATRLAVQVREVPHLRADPRFPRLLQAAEELVPSLDANSLATLLRCLVRLRADPSDPLLRHVLDACAAMRREDFSPSDLGELRPAGEQLGWALPPPLQRPPQPPLPPPSALEVYGPELHALKRAVHRCTAWRPLLDTLAAFDMETVHPVIACSALSKTTFYAAEAAEMELLRADARFTELLRTCERLVPDMAVQELLVVIRALLRLRVPASDAMLAAALHACAAKAQADAPAVARLMRQRDVAHLRAAADALGWDVPPALFTYWW